MKDVLVTCVRKRIDLLKVVRRATLPQRFSSQPELRSLGDNVQRF